MSRVAWSLLSIAVVLRGVESTTNSDFPELNMTATQMINYWGYPAETHYVTTDDGYILGLVRIPYGKGQSYASGRPVMYMQHGLDDSCTTWINNMPWQSAGFVFADAGYDVWMGNFRGNMFSRNHTTYATNSKEFWAFSWDQMAHSDLPAMINYVMSATGQQRIFYMGHSMGTTTAFAEMTAQSSISPHIISMHALGPVAKVTHMKGLLAAMAPLAQDADIYLDTFGDGEFTTDSAFFDELADTFCEADSGKLCADVIFAMCGPNTHEINETRMPVYINHAPGGTSANTVTQYTQNMLADAFQMWDYMNATLNQQHYGQPTPPQYDISLFTPPLYLWYGADDYLADPQDVEDYIIPNAQTIQLITKLPNYAHLDFVWGINATYNVYQPIISIIKDQK